MGRLSTPAFLLFTAALIATLFLLLGGQGGEYKAGPFAINTKTISHFPALDANENIAIGYNLANGLAFGRDTVVTHMPGVPQYLALFNKLMGIAEGTPTPGLLVASFIVAFCATSLLELTCAFAALRVLGFAFYPAGVFSFAIALIGAFGFDLLFPMSENIIPYIFFLQFACFIKIFWEEKTSPSTYACAVWGLTFLPLINILFGLTIAPSVALLWVMTLLALLWRTPRVPNTGALKNLFISIKTMRGNALWLPLGLTLALLSYEIATLDFEALWYWNVDVNKTQLLHPPQEVMAGAFKAQLKSYTINKLHYLGESVFGFTIVNSATLFSIAHAFKQHLFGSTILELAAAFAIFGIAFKPRTHEERNKLIILGIVVFSALMFSYWRRNLGYKSEVTCGIAWALIFWAVAHKYAWFSSARSKIFYRATAIFGAASLALIFYVLCAIDIAPMSTPARPAALDTANVCRFRQTENCRCLQISKFGYQAFLETDIRQCKSSYGTFGDMIFKNKKAKEKLHADLKRRDVAFLVYPVKNIDIRKEDIDSEIKTAFYDGGLHCIDYLKNSAIKLCYNP